MRIFGNSGRYELDTKNEEIHKMKQMLDNMSNIVMLATADADKENKIFYMNKTAREVLQKHRGTLNDGLGGRADVSNAMDNSIHQFHKDPERVKKILGDPALLPHSADIPLGDVTFRTRAFPIWDSKNPEKLLCYMACWDDITAEKEVEEQRAKEIEAKQYLESRIQQIATAMEEMSATVSEVAQNTSQASESAVEVAGNASDGQAIVLDAVSGMQKVATVVRDSSEIVGRLGDKSEKIGEIVNVIDDIADQTNLLALNAAIEAARAGEQGRGFAVVADEVRKLAESTVKATKEIGGMIKEIQSETGHAVSTMEQGTKEVELGEEQSNKAGEALEKIVGDIDSIKNVIAQIATASEEQAATAEEIARNLEEISQQ